VYEVMEGDRKPFVDSFEKGLHLYREGNFDAAKEKFRDALKMNPQDKPSQLGVERCNHLIQFPPEKDWDGIWDFET